ncbi:MAG TPA: hypothetical protein VNN76_00915 [Bacteroidota bacterium]|nr:hypothetical protein [Bacteroidota bacterium]
MWHVRIFLLILFVLALRSGGCLQQDEQPEEPEITTVSGSIQLPDSLATKDVILAFVSDFAVFNTLEVVDSFDVSPPYAFLSTKTISGTTATRTFRMDLPADRSGNRGLLAWVDSNPNLQPDFRLEPVRYPKKFTSTGEIIFTRWTYGINGRFNDYSIVIIRNGGLMQDFLSSLGNTDLTFTF